MKERLKSVAIIAMLVTGCSDTPGGMTIDENTIIYKGGGQDSEFIREHENCHREQMKTTTPEELWKNYIESDEYRCKIESECGVDDHPFCLGSKK